MCNEMLTVVCSVTIVTALFGIKGLRKYTESVIGME